MIGDTESSLCARGDFVAVIYTDSQKAGYVLLLRESFCLSIDQHYRSLFFKGIIFKVSEEVADLFLSLHAKRNEPVSLTPSAAYERKLHFVRIHYKNSRRLFQRHFSAPRNDLDSKSDSVEIICSYTTDYCNIVGKTVPTVAPLWHRRSAVALGAGA